MYLYLNEANDTSLGANDTSLNTNDTSSYKWFRKLTARCKYYISREYKNLKTENIIPNKCLSLNA